MSAFPLDIEEKEDHPAKSAAVAGMDAKYYVPASEFNKVVAALNELNARMGFRCIYIDVTEDDTVQDDRLIGVELDTVLSIRQGNQSLTGQASFAEWSTTLDTETGILTMEGFLEPGTVIIEIKNT